MKLSTILTAIALVAVLVSAAEAGRVVTAPSGRKVTITESCMTTCTEKTETRDGRQVKVTVCTTECEVL